MALRSCRDGVEIAPRCGPLASREVPPDGQVVGDPHVLVVEKRIEPHSLVQHQTVIGRGYQIATWSCIRGGARPVGGSLHQAIIRCNQAVRAWLEILFILFRRSRHAPLIRESH